MLSFFSFSNIWYQWSVIGSGGVIAACGTMLNSTASARLFIIIFSMDWSLYWTPMVCHWEQYCDWNASIAICGTILISTVNAHLPVSCFFFSFFFLFFFGLGNSFGLCLWQLYQLLCVPVVSKLFLFDPLTYELCIGASVLRIIIMVSDFQIVLVHAKEIRRCKIIGHPRKLLSNFI